MHPPAWSGPHRRGPCITKHGESHRLATTSSPEQAIYFLLSIFGKIAECRQNGRSWLVGHDGVDAGSIHAAKFHS
ncbi:hypothetical protein [Rhodococcus sp. ACT016]|uniref:hypothetical protein n=1 Tax=Rhodococcus sp. ACT016 TaxID=3134808 RepID=UPI003D2C0534